MIWRDAKQAMLHIGQCWLAVTMFLVVLLVLGLPAWLFLSAALWLVLR